MTTIQPGEFWVANIVFTDGSGAKKRPVLVLWIDGQDVEITDWRGSGLRKSSTVRLSRLDCLEQSLMIGRIGVIQSADAATIKQVWTQEVQPRF